MEGNLNDPDSTKREIKMIEDLYRQLIVVVAVVVMNLPWKLDCDLVKYLVSS